MAAGACGGVRFFLGPAGGSAIREPPLNLPLWGRRWWKRHSTKLQVSSAPMRKGTTRLPYSPKRFLYFHSLPLLFRLASLATFPKGEGFCCLLYILLPIKPEAVRLPRGRFLPFDHNKRMRADQREARRERTLRRRDPPEAAGYSHKLHKEFRRIRITSQ